MLVLDWIGLDLPDIGPPRFASTPIRDPADGEESNGYTNYFSCLSTLQPITVSSCSGDDAKICYDKTRAGYRTFQEVGARKFSWGRTKVW